MAKWLSVWRKKAEGSCLSLDWILLASLLVLGAVTGAAASRQVLLPGGEPAAAPSR